MQLAALEQEKHEDQADRVSIMSWKQLLSSTYPVAELRLAPCALAFSGS